jgi:ribosomal protein S17E
VLIEIWYLNFLNIKSVAKIARSCGFPDEINEDYENNLSALIAVGLEKKHKQLQSIGINPYMGLSQWKLFAYQIAIRFKAVLTNYLFKMLVRRLFGRYVLRAFIDLVGIPVYAFWNAYASRVIMREALIRIMAPPLIKKFVDQFYTDFGRNDGIKQIVYDSLQSISVSKRSYHYNHFLLSISLLNKFDIPVKENPYFNDDFHDYMRNADQDVKNAYSKVLVFGIIIDGKLSKREIRLLKEMQTENIVPYTIDEIRNWATDFDAGRGLDSFIYK